MTTTTTPTARLFASYNHWTDETQPQNFSLDVYTATREEAERIAASFPKSAKLRVTMVSNRGDAAPFLPGHTGDFYGVVGRTSLTSNGVNGGVNETGVRRYRTIVKTLAKLELQVTWMGEAYSNAYRTQEAFEAAISAS